jgi:hypothetical protein
VHEVGSYYKDYQDALSAKQKKCSMVSLTGIGVSSLVVGLQVKHTKLNVQLSLWVNPRGSKHVGYNRK